MSDAIELKIEISNDEPLASHLKDQRTMETTIQSQDDADDIEEWQRLQYLEYTTSGLQPQAEAIEEAVEEDYDKVISGNGLFSNESYNVSIMSKSLPSVGNIKRELRSDRDIALEELQVIYKHIAKITENIFIHDLDENDHLNDVMLDQLILDQQKAATKESRPSSISSMRGSFANSLMGQRQSIADPNRRGSTSIGLIGQRKSFINANAILALPESLAKLGKTFLTEVKQLNTKAALKGGADGSNSDQNDVRESSVENCKYPGFKNEEVTSLPKNVELVDIGMSVFDENRQFISKAEHEVYENFLMTTEGNIFLSDAFWYIMMDKYKTPSGSTSKEDLFNRMSEIFVHMLLEYQIAICKSFYHRFPSVLAQTIYLCFCEGFPLSAHLFTDSFRAAICSYTYYWITGLRANKECWLEWPIENLIPPLVRAHLTKPLRPQTGNEGDKAHTRKGRGISANKKSKKANAGDQGFNFDIERQASSKSSKIAYYEAQSTPMGPLPQTIRVPFDAYSKSPLVAHYLEQRKYGAGLYKHYKMHLTELKPAQAPKEPPTTYRQYIRASNEKSRDVASEFNKQYGELNKERKKATTSKMKDLKKVEDLRTRFSNRTDDSKLLSDQIVEGWITRANEHGLNRSRGAIKTKIIEERMNEERE